MINFRAEDAGIMIMMELGVDPGIDHMLAMEALDDIKNRGGEVSASTMNHDIMKP